MVFRLTMYPALDGDCLLLTWGEGGSLKHLVMDLGRAGTWKKVRPTLASIGEVELFAISHVDADHIAGAIPMLKDATPAFKPKRVWFNAFQQLERANTRLGKLEDFGARQGEKLSRGIANFQWPRNAEFASKIISTDSLEANDWIELGGGLKVLLISPDDQSLAGFIEAWEDELAKAKIRVFDPDEDEDPVGPLFEPFAGLPDVKALAKAQFSPDTAPANRTSIAFIAEFDGKRILFAGDSHSDVLERQIAPLAAKEGGRLKLDLLKVAHHGSKANTSPKFFSMIDCQRFAFSTDGSREHGHPNLETVARILVNDPERPKHLYFNYERPTSSMWKSSLLTGKWNYTAHFPVDEKDDGTLIIDL
ncbi:ComEC/Rec2 family competence protein [Pseudochelatococcus lubricantis]|uniref:ComEC/Rec2 family competence protein n=1 Tax=Pseudochelatococcus lubricantis TaxID=1538102 RepID=UPI0035EAB57A